MRRKASAAAGSLTETVKMTSGSPGSRKSDGNQAPTAMDLPTHERRSSPTSMSNSSSSDSVMLSAMSKSASSI